MDRETKEIKLAVIGGDLRSLAAAGRLSERFTVSVYGFRGSEGDGDTYVDRMCCSGGMCVRCPEDISRRFEGDARHCDDIGEALDGAAALILPLPASVDGEHITMPFSDRLIRNEDVVRMAAEHGVRLIAGGRLGNIAKLAERYGIEAFDYFEREDFAVANAVPTAEGAIAIAMNELPVTIDGASVLVVGYGRIGKLLAAKLKSLGANVTASARRDDDIAWIKASGINSARTGKLDETIDRIRPDVIFTTVPHTVIGKKELEVCGGALIIDLASKPGGVDIAAAGALGKRVIWALSLPGKTSPVTAGRIIADTVMMRITEISGGGEKKC